MLLAGETESPVPVRVAAGDVTRRMADSRRLRSMGLVRCSANPAPALMLQVLLGAKTADGDAGQCPAAAQTVNQLEARPVGKFDVADQEVELGLPRGGQGGREAVDRHNVVIPLLKYQREIPQRFLIILDEEDV